MATPLPPADVAVALDDAGAAERPAQRPLEVHVRAPGSDLRRAIRQGVASNVAMGWKRASRVVAAVAASAFIGGTGLWVYFAHRVPAISDASAHRVYPLAYHGGYVYVTHAEALLIWSLLGFSLVAFVVAVAFDRIRRATGRRDL
jgi:hypothetical protein